MENREAFTGILAEPEESIEEVSWKQNNYSPASRGRGYSNRGSNQGNYMEVTQDIIVKQRKQVLQATQR